MNFCLLNSTISNDQQLNSNLNAIQNPQNVLSNFVKNPKIIPGTLSENSVETKNNSQIENVNVSLKLPISAKFMESLQFDKNDKNKFKNILARSEISLMDMSRAVPPKYHHHTIRVILNIPQSDGSDSTDTQNAKDEAFACFNVEAPLSLFKDLNKSMPINHECSIHQNSENSSPRKLLAHTGDHMPPSWCDQVGASPIQLEYYQEPSWTVFITSEDKKLINLHLMATSVFLFALLGVIMLVFFVKGFVGNSRKVHSQRYSTESGDLSLTKINSA